jgi:hypothetical protein
MIFDLPGPNARGVSTISSYAHDLVFSMECTKSKEDDANSINSDKN